METRQQRKRYRTVSITDARSNREYKRETEQMFQETAARIVQRQWRVKHRKKFKGNYTETLNAPLSLRFIKEPWGVEASKHAAQINAGKWLKLDFAEPEFVRNIYKALHQGKITLNQQADALLLHGLYMQFKDAQGHLDIKQYRFDQAGPYDFRKISYEKRRNALDFKQRLAALPEAERCYFSVNFPRELEIAFLYLEVDEGAYLKPSRLESYVLKLDIAQIEKQKLLVSINNDRRLIKEYITEQMRAIAPDFFNFATKGKTNLPNIARDFSSIEFLFAGIRLNEQIPAIEISPDYNKQDPSSPLLCLIMPTVSALNALQHAMHGNDAVDPFFSAGQVTTRMIRDLDEEPTAFGVEHQSRPVELTHPDLMPNPKPHNFLSPHNFLLSWHDLFHCWRSGANMYKPFMRYLRQLLEAEKGFAMSKAIWWLTDMDLNVGREVREEAKLHDQRVDRLRERYLVEMVEFAADHRLFSYYTHEALLLIVDMHRNREQWQRLMGFDPGINLGSEGFRTMGKIIAEDFKQHNQYKSIKFYILAWLLRDFSGGLALCNELEKIGLNKFLSWGRNSGLSIRAELLENPGKNLINLFGNELYKQLQQAKNKLLLKEEKAEQKMQRCTRYNGHQLFPAQGAKRVRAADDKHKLSNKIRKIR